jgi:trehalose 6-phosphate synthase
MKRMRRQVADHNIYRWAGMLLSEAGRLVGTGPAAGGTEKRDATPYPAGVPHGTAPSLLGCAV